MKRIMIFTVFMLSVLAIFGLVTYQTHFQWPGDMERIQFESSGLKLNGVLIKPHAAPPHAATVILHGSGARDGVHDMPDYRVLANAFVKKGLAVLVYDKRGTGASEGDFATATYKDFVDDGVAAVQFLKNRSDIQSKKIGLMATSEGGWLSPEIAYRSGNLAFIVNKCGPPISWIKTVLFENENDMRKDGVDAKLITEILELQSQVWDFYLTSPQDDSKRQSLNEKLTEFSQKADLKNFGLPQQLIEANTEEFRKVVARISYDPAPFLQEIETPILALFGAKDVNVPTEASVTALADLKTRLHKDITIKVYPDAGHSLMGWTGFFNAGYVDDFLDLIGTFARSKVTTPSDTQAGVNTP